MNFTISKLQAKHPSQPIHRMQLARLLKLLGVKPVLGKKHHNKRILGFKPSSARLWDLFEESKRIWRERIAREHPDRGGDTAQAAIINSLYWNIKRRFEKMGIGI